MLLFIKWSCNWLRGWKFFSFSVYFIVRQKQHKMSQHHQFRTVLSWQWKVFGCSALSVFLRLLFFLLLCILFPRSIEKILFVVWRDTIIITTVSDCCRFVEFCICIFRFEKEEKVICFFVGGQRRLLARFWKCHFIVITNDDKNFGFLFSSFDNNLWLRRTLNFVIICFSHFNGEIEIVSWISATVVDERYCPFVIQKSDKMRKKNSSISKSNWIEMTSLLFTLSRHQSS